MKKPQKLILASVLAFSGCEVSTAERAAKMISAPKPVEQIMESPSRLTLNEFGVEQSKNVDRESQQRDLDKGRVNYLYEGTCAEVGRLLDAGGEMNFELHDLGFSKREKGIAIREGDHYSFDMNLDGVVDEEPVVDLYEASHEVLPSGFSQVDSQKQSRFRGNLWVLQAMVRATCDEVTYLD